MTKDSFLDTNVIFNYSNYTSQSSEIIKKCYDFIINKQSKFIVCWAVLEELREIIIKRARIHKAIIDIIQNPKKNSFEKNFLISKRDIPFAKQLYENFKNNPIEKIADYFRLERRLSEMALDKFLETLIDEKVIPFEQIKTALVNNIHDIISNHADCRIVASAIQLQETREAFLFVTADRKDLSPNQYAYLKEHFEINYSKEKHKFPELHNLMFVK